MWQVWDTAEVHIGLLWGELRERNHVEDLGVDGKNNIKIDLQNVGWGGTDWIVWLMTETGCCDSCNEPSVSII
jgi:hypothetical protein